MLDKLYAVAFNKITVRDWIQGDYDVEDMEFYETIKFLFKDLSEDLWWFDENKIENIIYVGEFEYLTDKLLSIKKYKATMDFVEADNIYTIEQPINPQLKQIFMKNFERIDTYE